MQSLTRSVRGLSRVAGACSRAPAVIASGVRFQSGGKKAAGGGVTLEEAIAAAAGNDDLSAIFEAVDAKGTDVKEEAVLPINISGSHAPYVELAFSQAGGIDGLAAVTKQLAAVHGVVTRADYSIARFFVEADYLPAETAMALNLLLTADVSLKNIDKIEDDDLREYFLQDEEVAAMWADARASIKDLKLGKPATAVLNALADAGHTAKLGVVVDSCNTVLSAASTVATVTIESAVPLSAAQKKDVAGALKKYLPKGKEKMEIGYTVDEGLVGGLLVHVDDVTMDLSSAAVSMAMADTVNKATTERV